MQESQIIFTAYPLTPGDCHEQLTTSESLEQQDFVSFYLTGIQTCQPGGMTSNHQTGSIPSLQAVSNIDNSNILLFPKDSCLSSAGGSKQKMSPGSGLLFENGVSTAKHESLFHSANNHTMPEVSGRTLLPWTIPDTGGWLSSFKNNQNQIGFGQGPVTNDAYFGISTEGNCCIVPNSLYGEYLHQDDQGQDIVGLFDMPEFQGYCNKASGQQSPLLLRSDTASEVCKKEQAGIMPHTSDKVQQPESYQFYPMSTPFFDANAEAKTVLNHVEPHSNMLSGDTGSFHCQYNHITRDSDNGVCPMTQHGLMYPPLPPFVPDFDIGSIDFDSCAASYNASSRQHQSLSVPLLDADKYSQYATAIRGGSVLGGQNHAAGSMSQYSQDQRDTSLRDTSKDEFLLECRHQGLSYKEIKARGGFEEAESTLRGRVRALTKPKEARVRRPDWTENDVIILKQTVEQFLRASIGSSLRSSISSHRHGARAQRHALSRIPWKQVAESMANRGCYHFGNATVKKKYMEVMDYQDKANDW